MSKDSRFEGQILLVEGENHSVKVIFDPTHSSLDDIESTRSYSSRNELLPSEEIEAENGSVSGRKATLGCNSCLRKGGLILVVILLSLVITVLGVKYANCYNYKGRCHCAIYSTDFHLCTFYLFIQGMYNRHVSILIILRQSTFKSIATPSTTQPLTPPNKKKMYYLINSHNMSLYLCEEANFCKSLM